jgi:hypothetical protein
METLQEAKWTQAAKDAYYKEHPENFADPKSQGYPIRDASDVGDAWGLAGHADHPDQVRAKIIAIAKRLKLTHGLPDTAQDFAKETITPIDSAQDGAKESVVLSDTAQEAPAKETIALPGVEQEDVTKETTAPIDTTQSIVKEAVVLPTADTQSNCIARLKVCWIEDNVISLNNRQYTQQAVDSLIASGQARIADSNALPLTCYLSHEDAELDKTLCLVGRVSQIWREGAKGMALIDVPDTSAGRDLLSLCEGGFIKSISLRASDPQMQVSRNASMPQVIGATLQGIDFTTSPGLSQIARITDVLRESFKDENMLIEAFPSLENTMKKLKEDGIEPLANGVTVGVADTTPGDGYANRTMTMPPKFQEPGDEPAMASAVEAHKIVHDHLANVLDATVAPIHGKESSALPTLSEAGRKIAMAHATKLVAAHDEAAKQASMSCEGGYESHVQKMMKPADDGMDDGDDDDDDKPNGNNGNNNGDDDDDDDDNSESFVLNLIKEAQKQEARKVAKEAKKIAKQLIQETYAKQELHTQKAPLPIQKEPVKVQKEPAKQPIKEANKPMTPEERARLLEELQKDGFEIKPPKTVEEKRQEEFDAMLNAKIAEAQEKMQAQFDAKLAEMQQRIPQRFMPTPPQRKSMVEGANADTEAPKRTYYRHGDYLREQLSNREFREQLLDRSRPLPKDINIEHLLNELKKEYLGMYDAKWGLTGDVSYGFF